MTIAAGHIPPTPATPAMTEREVALAMIALTASLFVAHLSNLIVLTAMPRITADLHATQAHYTWIITASMLTLAVSTPIWGRISDALNKKLLMQVCVAAYVSFSFVASLAPSPWVIIACRVGIGICAAGIIVLMQTISAAIMSSRARARWIGYRAAAMSVATVGAPSIGGFVTEHLGWRACFLIGIPFAIISILLLRRNLHLPPRVAAGRIKVDWIGAILLAAGVIALLLWISVTGPNRGFFSPIGGGLLVLAIALLAVMTLVELRVALPILPLDLFRSRDITLCVIASACAGVGFFGSAVFLAPYLQIGRGLSPSEAGLMALPEAGGSLVASLLTARIISRHGRYKPTLIVGAAILLGGFVLLATIGQTTSFLLVAVYVALVGAGLGVTGETLTIVVQNAAKIGIVGAAGALVGFFRVLGGIAGVAVLGLILTTSVQADITATGVTGFDPSRIPMLPALQPALRTAVEAAYAQGAAIVYLCCIPVALVMLVAMTMLSAGSLSDENPLSAR
ncbi:MFS transporter [Sphingomonas sp. ID0503]|uniref:MFS transporter n=1 Tax=Sphingomonas sp. ID0503 TaxID=3399691 RepID=UPI003AFB107C